MIIGRGRWDHKDDNIGWEFVIQQNQTGSWDCVIVGVIVVIEKIDRTLEVDTIRQ
jgi:hypothetical protein